MLACSGHQNNTAKQLKSKQIRILHFIFHRLSVVLWLEKGADPHILQVVSVIITAFCLIFYVFGSWKILEIIINSVLFNLLCVWVLENSV